MEAARMAMPVTRNLSRLEHTISSCVSTPPPGTTYLPPASSLINDLPTPPSESEDEQEKSQDPSRRRSTYIDFHQRPTLSLEPPCTFPLISQHPPIYALTAEQYNLIYETHTRCDQWSARKAAAAAATASHQSSLHPSMQDDDENSLWPFLHGVGYSNLAQNNFFSCHDLSHTAMVPRYRGLTTVSAEASWLEEINIRSRSSSSASAESSASSTHRASNASASNHNPPHHHSKRGRIQCSQLVSSVEPSDILQPVAEPSSSSSSSKSTSPAPSSSRSHKSGAGNSRDADGDITLEDASSINDPSAFRFPPPTFVRPNVNLRAFRIQPSQYASISDIVIYGERGLTPRVLEVAKRAAAAIEAKQEERQGRGLEYNVFVITDSFEHFEENYPHLVAVTGMGEKRNTIDFLARERDEMRSLTKASPISRNGNVWLGNAADNPDLPCLYTSASDRKSKAASEMVGRDSAISLLSEDKEDVRFREALMVVKKANPNAFEISIDTQDTSMHWGPREYDCLGRLLEENGSIHDPESGLKYPARICEMAFSIQSLYHRQDCVDAYLVSLIHIITFIQRQSVDHNRRILIHCGDGYTESSMLALSYIMFDRQCSVAEAYLVLQNEYNRSFFVYMADVRLLQRIDAHLRQMRAHGNFSKSTVIPLNVQLSSPPPSPSESTAGIDALTPTAKSWYEQDRERYPWFYSPRFEGSFPSRILPFLYLGNLNHAANATMLRDLGITHVLSVGENADLPPRRQAIDDAVARENEDMGFEVLYLSNLYDDGIDSLSRHVDRCLDFIEDARIHGGKVLVHCRVGVSRSATITMAYVMKHLDLPVVPAYLLVRARRLSTIVQPNLRFLYELLQFEGRLRGRRSVGWSWLAKEVACLNSIYSIV